MKLYYSPGACSLAPHVALREVGVEFELARIVVADREHVSPDYLKINPRARVPALETGGRIFTEVPALLVYIASLRPESGLMPSPGSAFLARTLEWLGWFSSTFHTAYACVWRPERFLPPGVDSEALTAFGRTNVERLNAELEERLAGPWLVEEGFGLADLYALPFFRWGNRIGLDMDGACPRWAEWTSRMLERPSVRASLQAEGLTAEQFLPAGSRIPRSCS